MSRSPAVLALLLVGCTGPLVPGAAGSSGEAETTTGTQSPPETGPLPTTAPPGTTASTAAVTTAVTTRGSSGYGSTGLMPGTTGSSGDESDTRTSVGGFIVDPDGGGGCGAFCPTSGVMASCFVCSYFDQDCGAGEVCKPADVCDSGTWSLPVCRPAPEDANGQPGEPCTMEENPFSGIDTCAPNSMCFDVDPMTLEGTCVGYCDSFIPCDDPTQACFEGNDGWVPLCLPSCSPLLSDCPVGEGCYPGTDNDFACIPQSQPLHTDLTTLHPACPPDSFMSDEEQLGSCPDEGSCCAAFCDLAAPGCADGSVCIPFFDDLEDVDPAHHNVGFCAPDPG